MNVSKTISRLCPSCKENNFNIESSKYSNEQWKIKECKSCDFVYIETVPIYEEFIEEFAWEKTSSEQKKRRQKKNPLLQTTSKYIKKVRHKILKRNKLQYLIKKYIHSGNILDIGCAEATILKSLNHNCIPYGIEISSELVKKAHDNLAHRNGIIIHDNALNGLKRFDDNLFNAIILSAFLEHEINPKELLREVYRVLSPLSICIIKVPNFNSINRFIRGEDWCGFRLPDHVNYFTPKSLNNMCKEVGFNILKFSFLDKIPTSDNMWIIIQKSINK